MFTTRQKTGYQSEHRSTYHTDKLALNRYIEDKSLHKYDGVQSNSVQEKPILNIRQQFPNYTLKTGLNTCVVNTQTVEIPEIIVLTKDEILSNYHVYIGKILITEQCTKITYTCRDASGEGLRPTKPRQDRSFGRFESSTRDKQSPECTGQNVVLEFINITDNIVYFSQIQQNRTVNIPPHSTVFVLIVDYMP